LTPRKELFRRRRVNLPNGDELRALTVAPGIGNSARLEDVSEPDAADGAVLVRTVALGVCGTDREIISGEYGTAPPGQKRLILGHESLGRVETAPPGSGLIPGDLVVGIVRRPDPVPCCACAAGEWDMCRNGGYTERGIKERHGYGAEYFRIEPEFVIKLAPTLGLLGVLIEPASILAKAWDHVDRIGGRFKAWRPHTLLVTGAGPIGLLAALMGAQRGLKVHAFDRGWTGLKPQLVRALGGTQHSSLASALERLQPDIVMECTGSASVIGGLLGRTSPGGIICLLGVSAPGQKIDVDMGKVNRTLVLDNDVVFGSVNANHAHYEKATQALADADQDWLRRLITRRVPLDRWAEALEHRPGDIKAIIDFSQL
jgi:threonine dehydrogenase-like Zn-dependent dehydrogenase